MNIRRLLYLAAAGILALAALLALRGWESAAARQLATDVRACNTEPTEMRFSCYRSAIERNYGNDFDGLLRAARGKGITFESDDGSYAVFGTNCHTFYHAVGDYIAVQKDGEPVAKLVEYCTTDCTSACVMGLYKRTALNRGFDEKLLADFWTDCPAGSEHQCSHEIGHLLHDKYTTAILATIDRISADKYGLRLADAQYTLFPEPDLDAPFVDCQKLVPDFELPYCYTGIGHNLFLLAEFDPRGYDFAFEECERASSEYRSDCYDFLVYRIGINEAAVRFLSGRPDEGVQICEQVAARTGRPELEKHCYLGIGGGVGLFVDSEFSHVDVTEKNLALLQREVLGKINLCEHSKAEFKGDCYKGLLGTKVKKLYQQLNLEVLIFEEIIPLIESDFEVVG